MVLIQRTRIRSSWWDRKFSSLKEGEPIKTQSSSLNSSLVIRRERLRVELGIRTTKRKM
jgi:hypothetical protein